MLNRNKRIEEKALSASDNADVADILKLIENKKGIVVTLCPSSTQKNLNYLFFQIEYSTHTATKPTTPSPPNALTIPVTLPITSVAGKNGIAAPLNRTSNTIANAKTLTAVSARAFAHFLIVAKISINRTPI